jgi:hypothetical protein
MTKTCHSSIPVAAIVSKKGVKPTDEFVCSVCGDVTFGTDIHSGVSVYYAKRDQSNPNNNEYRCDDCESDRWLR